MNRRAIITILIATMMALVAVSLLGTYSVVHATTGNSHTLDESLLLMVSSELWLTGGGNPVVNNQPTDLSLPLASASGQADILQTRIV